MGALKEKILNKEELSEEEVEEALDSFNVVSEKVLEQNRWNLAIESIIEVEGRFFSIFWDRAATEYQDNYFIEQTLDEVALVEKTVKVWQKI